MSGPTPGDAPEQDVSQILEDALTRIQLEPDSFRRAQLLFELARYFEHTLADPGRALTARLAAYREEPRLAAWTDLARLADAGGAWTELLPQLGETVAELAPAEQPAAWLHLEALLRAHGTDAELLRFLEERCAVAPELEARAWRTDIAALYAKLGDRNESISRYEDLRLETPNDLALLRALEALYVEEQRPRELLDVLEAQASLLSGARDLAPLYRRMAVEWEEQFGMNAKAEECLEMALSLAPSCDEAYCALERLYCADGNWRAAVDVYCRHAAVAPPAKRADLYARAARISERDLGDVAGAIEFYRKLEEDRPGSVDAMSAPIRLYETTEDFEQVVALIERRAARAKGTERAELYHRAAELTRHQLFDLERAVGQLAHALEANAAHAPSMLSLAGAYREQGKFLSAAKLLSEATAATPNRLERTRLMVLEADARRAGGDVERAIELYAAALEIDPEHVLAAEGLVALLEQTQEMARMRAPLEMLAARAPDAERRLAHQLRLACIEEQLGHPERALDLLERAIAARPAQHDARHAHAALLFRLGRFADAHAALSHLVEDAHELPPADQVELRWQLGTCARALGRADDAHEHFAQALGLDPDHRPSLRAQIELDQERPSALLDHLRALLRSAPPEEQRALHVSIGDLLAGPLGDATSGLAAYRAALALAPDDRRVLHKCLDVCVAERAWDDTLKWLARLVALERVDVVRAKLLVAAAMICREELGDVDEAIRLLTAAIDADPLLERAAQPLEEIWMERRDWTALANLHRTRLERLGHAGADGQDALRGRLWSKLGELCLNQGDCESALAALQVAARFDPENLELHRLLAVLFVQAGPDQLDHAITEHQKVITGDPEAIESYAALEQLYRRIGLPARSAACGEARAFLERRRDAARATDLTDLAEIDDAEGAEADELLVKAGATVTSEMWTRLSHPHEDRFLSALFTQLAPLVAAKQAQTHRQLRLERRDQVASGDPRPFARALKYVARVFAVPTPDTFVRYHEETPAQLITCIEQQRLMPTILVGKPLLGHRRSERELVFELARQMAYLRSGRIVRLLLPDPAELAQLVEAAMVLGVEGELPKSGAVAAMVALLRASLDPVALHQVATIGQCLRARGAKSDEAALGWLRATDLTASRAALLVVGDLLLCARLIEREVGPHGPSLDARILDLVASSVGDAIWSAREHLKLVPRATRNRAEAVQTARA